MTRRMIARLDESTQQIGAALRRLHASYGDGDAVVLLAARSLERRYKLLSYLNERNER